MLFQRIRHFTIESFVVSFYEFDTLLFETISYWFSKRTIKLAFQKVPPNDQITYVALPNSKCEIRHNRLYHSIIPRIFQYGSDGVRALLSGFSNLESLFPHPNSLSGDWVWPTAVYVGLLWPFGFIFGAIIVHLLGGKGWPNEILYFLYIPILWLWAAILWLYFLNHKM